MKGSTTTWQEFKTAYHIFITLIHKENVGSLFLQVLEKAPICHERHHDVRSRTSIQAHSNKAQDIGMVKTLHLQTFIHNLVYLVIIKEPWNMVEKVTCVAMVEFVLLVSVGTF